MTEGQIQGKWCWVGNIKGFAITKFKLHVAFKSWQQSLNSDIIPHLAHHGRSETWDMVCFYSSDNCNITINLHQKLITLPVDGFKFMEQFHLHMSVCSEEQGIQWHVNEVAGYSEI